MRWEESDNIVEQMIKGSTGELWGVKLEQSDHFPLLSHVLNHVGNEGDLVDIGCGAGDVSRVWKGNYTGVDLDWVIRRVSKICNPTCNYISLDLTVESVSNLPKFRIALMNAFLDVRDDAHEIFDQILANNIDSLIVHRQRLSQNQHFVEKRPGYGGSEVPSSVMSLEKIVASVEKIRPTAKILLFHWQQDYYTFIVSES